MLHQSATPPRIPAIRLSTYIYGRRCVDTTDAASLDSARVGLPRCGLRPRLQRFPSLRRPRRRREVARQRLRRDCNGRDGRAPEHGGGVSTRTLSIILHGHEWPDPSWTQALRAVLAVPPGAGPGSVIEVLEAREESTRAIGAAAAINRAAAAAAGDLLLIVEAGCSWDKRLLAELGTAVWHADVLAVGVPGRSSRPGTAPSEAWRTTWNDAWIPGALSAQTDLMSLVREAGTVTLDEWSIQLVISRPRLWAIRRSTFRALGELDSAFWSVAPIEDLAMRASARGVPVHLFEAPPAADSPHDAWPLRAPVRQLLALRNALLSAARGRDPQSAGRVFGVIASLGFADAWRSAQIPPEALRFGGSWGTPPGALSRRLSKGQPAEGLWPAHPAASVLPVLALDSFLDELVARLNHPSHVRQVQTAATPDQAAGPERVASTRDSGSTAPSAHESQSLAQQPPQPTVDRGDGSLPFTSVTVASGPFVSVIVVNWNGREHLETCFASLLASDYPSERIEFLLVDNGSTDASADLVSGRFPAVRIVRLAENRGFTGGNRAGVEAARGDVLVFFNNDMRVASDAIRLLVSSLDADRPCAAAEVRSWNGRRIDFVRGSMNFEAHGFQDHYGEAWRADRATSDETFFPNGGAFAITRDAYERAGGFDGQFFAYYDDVDLGYGVRLNGGRIRVVHEARVFHRHGATSRRYPSGQKRFLMERNAIWTALKRYEPATLDRTFGAILLLAARRIAQETVLHRRTRWVETLAPFSSRCRARAMVAPDVLPSLLYDQASSPASARTIMPEDRDGAVVASMPVESLAAVGEALRGLPEIAEKRREIQRRRIVSDRAVFTAMGRPLAYGSPLSSYQVAHDAVVETLRLAEVFRSRPRLLIITHEPLRRLVSGPGVRVLELGRALARSVSVTIATPAEPEIESPPCPIVGYAADRPATLRRLAEQADVLLVQGFTLTQFPFLTGLHVPIAVDLYCPFSIEYLEMKTAEARARGADGPDIDAQLEAVSVIEVQNAQLRHGDFFICASERQRDFWLGALHTAGRINAQTYAADPSLRNAIDVVPFGVPQQDFEEAAAVARKGRGALKGVRPGIGVNDRVLFWGGSLLDWQDPLTLIRAVARLTATRADAKLFFAGTRHPNPQIPKMQMVEASETLARDLGLLDKTVFFNDWIPYEERAAYLKESDIGLSTHRFHLETHLSFRTRILDYIWAGLPILCTEGDYFADLVTSRGLGLVVPPGNDEALARAIARLLDDTALHEDCRAALRSVRDEFRWARVAEPLRRFAITPQFAADHEPAIRAIREKLRRSFATSKWIKRTALRLGVSEAGFEQIKSAPPVRIAIHVRNRLALARAGRPRA